MVAGHLFFSFFANSRLLVSVHALFLIPQEDVSAIREGVGGGSVHR